MLHPGEITGVVLAGGKSSRFGSNKAMQPFKGRTFLQHIIGQLEAYTSEVVIAGYYPEYENAGIPVLKDIYGDTGPLGGIYTALHYCKTPWALVLTCDMPFITNEIIEFMLESTDVDCTTEKDDNFSRAEVDSTGNGLNTNREEINNAGQVKKTANHKTTIIGWKNGENLESFPMLLSKEIMPALQKAMDAKLYKVKQIFTWGNPKIIAIPPGWQHYFENINNQEDYKQIIE